MVKTMPVSPSRQPHTGLKQTVRTHEPDHHKHPHQHQHQHVRHSPRARDRHGLGGVVTLILSLMAVAAAVLWYWLAPVQEDADQMSETLMTQMQQAARGNNPLTHAYGGPLNVVEKDGRLMVVAFALPTKACVQAGWRLSKQGLILVNGLLPPRLSAARLAELCSQNEGGAVLTWIPALPAGE